MIAGILPVFDRLVEEALPAWLSALRFMLDTPKD